WPPGRSRSRSRDGGFPANGKRAASLIPGTMGRRRAAIIRYAWAIVSMSATGITASHPRHFRHVAAEGCRAYQHQPGFSAPDAYLLADPAAAQGPQHLGGGGRGRGEA